MWQYLSGVHPLLPYSLTLIAVIAVVIIALKGKLLIKIGKNTIGIGSTNEPLCENSNSQSSPLLKKRTCADCAQIMINEYENNSFSRKEREDKILTYRMNYSEEKLIEFESDILNIFEGHLEEAKNDFKVETIEVDSKLFYGLFKDAMSQMKKEIRRSFKENGFCELSDLDFNNYVKDKSKVLLSVLLRHLKNIYPTCGTIVSIDTILSDIEGKTIAINEYLKDIYVFAKQVIIENEHEVEALKNKFNTWKADFIK